MFKYIYNKQINILEAKASEVLKIEDVCNHYKHLADDINYPKNLKILIDCRHTKMNIEPNEILCLKKQLNKTMCKYNYLMEAILVKSPFETAIVNIFEMQNIDIENFSFNIFSTKEAALDLLMAN